MIRWHIQSIVDHPDLSAVQPPAGLLTPEELRQFRGFLHPRRQRDWLLGRWTTKRLIQAHITASYGFCPALDSFTIKQDPRGVPYATSEHPALRGLHTDGRMPVALSISHSHGYALCVLSADDTGRVRLGADIELVESRAESFIQEFFTSDERAILSVAPPEMSDLLATATWSVKEAALKATHQGLRADPRSIQCRLRPGRPRHWTPLRIEMRLDKQEEPNELGPLRAWWRVLSNRLRPGTSFVLTIAAYGVNL